MLRRLLGTALSIVAILLVAACSTAADHSDMLASFADSTAKASASLDAYDVAAAAYMTSLTKAKALAGQSNLVAPLPDDCNAGDFASATVPRCRVVLLEKADAKGGIPIIYTTIIPNHVAVANEIAAYAKALNDLAKADSTALVSAALDKIAATATAIAAAAYPMGGGPALAAIAQPTASAFSWVYGKYQEQFKIDALRKATQNVDPLIQKVALMYGNVANFVGDVQEGELQKLVNDARILWLTSPSGSHLDDYLSKADALDKQLGAGPAKMFTDMGKAHAKLTESLKDNVTSLADAQAAIARLAADAEAVYKIAQSFKIVGDK